MRQKPLPGRTSIVVTRDPVWGYEGVDADSVLAARSLGEALEKARAAPGGDEVFVGGGAQIYEQALPFADRLYLTLVDAEEEGDAYFPAYEGLFTKKLSAESREYNGLKYKWVTLEK